jgi:hypothetical protein
MFSEDKSSEVKYFEEEKPEVTTLRAKQATGDRRRPGRIESPSLALISLLRHPTVVIDTDADYHDLRPSEGIVRGVLLSVPLWAFIISGVFWVVR